VIFTTQVPADLDITATGRHGVILTRRRQAFSRFAYTDRIKIRLSAWRQLCNMISKPKHQHWITVVDQDDDPDELQITPKISRVDLLPGDISCVDIIATPVFGGQLAIGLTGGQIIRIDFWGWHNAPFIAFANSIKD
jgi:hypothetical protein